MKKFITTLLVLITAVVACCSFTACSTKEETVTAEVKITVYKGTDASEEVTLKYNLYKNLAPKSVAQIVDLAKSGYYNGMFLYEAGNQDGSTLYGTKTLGEVKYADGKVTLAEEVNYIAGEFPLGGTTGSNLTTKIGSVCLWHWAEANTSGSLSDSHFSMGEYDTSSAGMLIFPTKTGLFKDQDNGAYTVSIAGYVDDDSLSAFKLLAGLTVDDETYDNWDSYDTYHIFYEVGEDNTLTKKLLTAEEYEDYDKDNIYDPTDKDAVIEGYEISKYQHRTVKAPKYNYRIVVNSVTVK